MRTTPEGRVTKDVKKLLERFKRAGAPLWYFKVHGHLMQMVGLPDFIMCFCGQFVGLELKAGRNEPTPLQVMVMRAIHAAGGHTIYAWNAEQVETRLTEILKEYHE